MVSDHLTPQASDEARQVASIARRSTLEVLSEAGIAVSQMPLQRPHAPMTRS